MVVVSRARTQRPAISSRKLLHPGFSTGGLTRIHTHYATVADDVTNGLLKCRTQCSADFSNLCKVCLIWLTYSLSLTSTVRIDMSSLQQLKQQSADLEGEQGCFLATATTNVAVVSPVKAQSTRNDCLSLRHLIPHACNLEFR
jgi:hypothetical protein